MSVDYLPPFGLMQAALEFSDNGEVVTMSKEIFTMLIAGLADAAGFDAAWYCEANPDVATAVSQGDVADGLQHFSNVGYEEGRAHRLMPINETWYREAYADVDRAMREEEFDLRSHFDEFGYLEGRANNRAAGEQAERWAAAIERSASLLRDRVGRREP